MRRDEPDRARAPVSPQAADSVLVRTVHVASNGHANDAAVDVWLEDGRVRAIGPDLGRTGRSEVIDGRGLWLLPGWIDLQVNDCAWLAQGRKTSEEHARRVGEVLEHQAARGVTGIVLATLAAPLDDVVEYLRGIAKVLRSTETAGDGILIGALVEGTFMNPEFCGAHNPKWVLPPSTHILERLLETGGMKLLNVAPEMGLDAIPVIEAATARGVVVGVGHAKPHAERLRQAVAAGLRYVIHLGNGPTGSSLKGFHDGGMLEEALRNDQLMVTAIIDGIHVQDQLIRDWLARKEFSRFIAVSDAGFAMGTPEGEFEVFGIRGRVEEEGRFLRVVDEDDSEERSRDEAAATPRENPFSSDTAKLFGAAIGMHEVFENTLNLLTREMEGVYHRSHAAMSLPDAVQVAARLCAANPATLLGERDRGRLAVGARADALLASIRGKAGQHQVAVHRVWLGSD